MMIPLLALPIIGNFFAAQAGKTFVDNVVEGAVNSIQSVTGGATAVDTILVDENGEASPLLYIGASLAFAGAAYFIYRKVK